jgi:hypothetical protein
MKRVLTDVSARVNYCIMCDEIFSRLPQSCTAHHAVKMTKDTAKRWRLPMSEHPETEDVPTEERPAARFEPYLPR